MKNPKILYLSAHSIHCYDDYRLFLELGCEVFEVNGAYTNPHKPSDNARPAIPEGKVYPELIEASLRCSQEKDGKEDIDEELIKWCDIIYVQHKAKKWIPANWEKAKKHGKKILWRGAGQSVESVEEAMEPYRKDGMLIVRYSPREKLIPGYIGEDAMIRFYKDPDEWKGWNGKKERVVTVCQSLGRPGHSVPRNWQAFNKSTNGFNRKVYGRDNQHLKEVRGYNDLWGGEVSYKELQKVFRDNRAYFYVGTMPASYTLNFMEAFMTGIPIVSIGEELGNPRFYEPEQDTFEIQDFIEHGVNGFISDDISELRRCIQKLLNDHKLAKKIGEAGRKSAIEHFGKEKIKAEWQEFFDLL